MHGLVAPLVFDLLRRIGEAQSAADVWKTYLQAARHVGLPYGIAAFTSVSPTALGVRLITSAMPRDWVAHYDDRNFTSVNPLARQVPAARRPFAFDIRDWRSENPLLDELRDGNLALGIRGGICVPSAGRDAGRAIVLCGRTDELAPNDRRSLHFAALVALQRMEQLAAPPPPSPDLALSAREAECLKWVAMGKSDWEIGAILSLSEKTVNIYVERAKKKLASCTRAQAVVKALRNGAIVL